MKKLDATFFCHCARRMESYQMKKHFFDSQAAFKITSQDLPKRLWREEESRPPTDGQAVDACTNMYTTVCMAMIETLDSLLLVFILVK